MRKIERTKTISNASAIGRAQARTVLRGLVDRWIRDERTTLAEAIMNPNPTFRGEMLQWANAMARCRHHVEVALAELELERKRPDEA